MGTNRHKQFREAWAVVRVDDFRRPELPPEEKVTVKEVWLSLEEAEREIVRLNNLSNDSQSRYLVQYTRLHLRDGKAMDDD